MSTLKSFIIEPIGIDKHMPKKNDFAEFESRTDLEIWAYFNDGNSDVLIYLYHKYVAQLLKFGLQFAPRENVKDSIQDLFLYLKERKNDSNQVKNISAYLYKSLYRILQKKQESSMKLSPVDFNSDIKNWQISISKEVNIIEKEKQKEQKQKLQNSLNELSSKQRQALLLYYYEGFTHKEITDIMELKNKSSVRKLIYRALDSLKESFYI
jgi:RNA polymerase sigma factor (sigma-70 family)